MQKNQLYYGDNLHASTAQIAVFEDSWHWKEQAELEFDELLHQPNTNVAQMMQAPDGNLPRYHGQGTHSLLVGESV